MRLKQLLGTIVLAVGTTAMATASVSQLSGVLVKRRDGAGIVTILASGTFHHTEYRPADNLMLIDLAGVSITNPDPVVHTVYAPGLRSYRVLGYRSASGAETARVEVNLLPGAKVDVSDIAGGVELRVTGAPAAVPSKEEISAYAAALSGKGPVNHIRQVSVSRGQHGLSVEITGSGPLTAKTMRLTRPDRLVLDIPNSVLEGRPRDIAVNSSDVKAVRVARFQDAPPTTRIVLDLTGTRDFDVLPEGNKLSLKLRESLATTPSATAKVNAVAAPPASITPLVTPSLPAAKTAKTDVAPATIAESRPPRDADQAIAAAQSRADVAASHFSSGIQSVPSSNRPPFPASSSLSAKPAAINAALQQQVQAGTSVAIGPSNASTCITGRYTGEPIGLNFKDLDLKDFFRVIQEISGLNVVLDPAVKGSVSIYLNDVPWDQALAIVLQNNGLECQLQGNVLRIATLETLKNEAEARRAQQEAQALAVPKQTITRYLSYGQSKDAAPIVKKFLSPRGDVMADPRSNSLVIEDIPSTLPKIEELIKALDRKTPEVEIEARVVASTRSFARDIGTQLAVGFATGNSAIGGGVSKSPVDVNNPFSRLLSPVGDSKSIPLFTDLGATAPTSGLTLINATNNFRLDFILTMAESRGLIKILSRPHITTQNNIAATVRQGVQIPVVTLAQLGGPPTVQYISAFLRLTVTPQITAENTIFLNIDVENTTPDFTHVTAQQLNPALDTQQATTSVLIHDGGTVVIGGVVQTQNNLAIAQVPLLGSVPVLGNLFKRITINTQTQELIFFITPKIIET